MTNISLQDGHEVSVYMNFPRPVKLLAYNATSRHTKDVLEESIEIKGYHGKYYEFAHPAKISRGHQLQVYVGDDTIVSFMSNTLPKEWLMAFASAVDYDKIKQISSAYASNDAKTSIQEQAQGFNFPNLGAYGKLSTFCGSKIKPVNPETIPFVGCFYLSSGHSAETTFVTHQVKIEVDSSGNEVFTVDGTLVKEDRNTPTWTNLPYVSEGGVAGYSICKNATNRNTGSCPSNITIVSRNPDKSVLFWVSNCLPPDYRICGNTQDQLDYWKAHPK